MIFLSAGHSAKSIKSYDPGAVNKDGIKEGILTIEFRDLVCHELDMLGVKYIKDSDEESLSQYLKRIKTGSGSTVIEYHMDSASNETASGATAIVGNDADRLDKAFAKEIAENTAAILGIKNRGVISEGESHRGKLGLMREEGIVSLCELCFISNFDDLDRYNLRKRELAKSHALLLRKYEQLL